jgi:NAD-dependent dihydropyrimidine dehydrogenase PreA subunit
MDQVTGRSGERPAKPRLVAVIGDDCTGCQSCVEYCLVDCIEPAPPKSASIPAPTVEIREDECIGCFVCAKVCEELTTNAIHLVPVDAGENPSPR